MSLARGHGPHRGHLARVGALLVLLSGCFDWSSLAQLYEQPAMDAGAPADAALDQATFERDAGCETPFTHANGAGQTWTDCAPPGTYDEVQALRACVALVSSPQACQRLSCPGGGAIRGSNATLNRCGAWQYEGPNAGKVALGTVTAGGCGCPSDSASTTWH